MKYLILINGSPAGAARFASMPHEQRSVEVRPVRDLRVLGL